MIDELKATLIPLLRKAGFKGSSPHFRRINDDGYLDFVTIQFSSGGGAFVIECSVVDPERSNVAAVGKDLPATKLNTTYTLPRYRLATPGHTDDYWFMYEKISREGCFGSIKELAEKATELMKACLVESI